MPYDGPLEILPGIFSIYVFDPNDIRLEFSCQPSNGEGEPCIVPQVTQTKAEALKELRSLTRDEQWLAAVTGDLQGLMAPVLAAAPMLGSHQPMEIVHRAIQVHVAHGDVIDIISSADNCISALTSSAPAGFARPSQLRSALAGSYSDR